MCRERLVLGVEFVDESVARIIRIELLEFDTQDFCRRKIGPHFTGLVVEIDLVGLGQIEPGLDHEIAAENERLFAAQHLGLVLDDRLGMAGDGRKFGDV